MSQENKYYVMPAEFAKNYIPNMHQIAEQFTSNGFHSDEKPVIVKNTKDLLKKVKALPDEGEFKMTYGDCLLLYHIMMKVKIPLHQAYPSLKKQEEEGTLNEDGKFNLKLNTDMQESIDNLLEDMGETFPALKTEVIKFKNALHKLDRLFRKMEVDNKNPIIRFYLKEEIEQKFFLLIFQMFDFMILKTKNEFSEAVREAHFFYESDFTEVFKKVEEAINANATEIDLTLRDVVVVYIAGNITQKLFLTDAGDEIMVMFNKISLDVANAMSATDLRSLYLQLAAHINEVIEENIIDKKTFTTFIEPVKEFAI